MGLGVGGVACSVLTSCVANARLLCVLNTRERRAAPWRSQGGVTEPACCVALHCNCQRCAACVVYSSPDSLTFPALIYDGCGCRTLVFK